MSDSEPVVTPLPPRVNLQALASRSQLVYSLPVIHKHIGRSRQENSAARLYVSEMHALPPLHEVGEPPRKGCNAPSDLLLYVDEALGPAVDARKITCGENLRSLYKGKVADVVIPVRVIQQVEYRRAEDILPNILRKPGVNPASHLYVINVKQGRVHSMLSLTPATYACMLQSRVASPRHLYSTFVSSFALAHHANLFAWLQFANLGVRHLTIKALGTGLWDTYAFKGHLASRRILPLLSLVACIIAYKPYGIRWITITGLGAFTVVMREIWDAIPKRIPMTRENALVDMLVALPFEGYRGVPEEGFFNETGRMQTRQRIGNMFGLRSSMQWQAMIMKARHGINEPQWQFVEVEE